MAISKYYHLQCNFNAGEISAEVANQVTLDKYQYALLKAQNVLVKPHGPVYKRPGTKYIAEQSVVASQHAPIVVTFTGTDDDYLVEIYHQNIKIYYSGSLVWSTSSSPFLHTDLESLRFAQSGSVMFITSGRLPVKKLTMVSASSWTLTDFTIDYPYFDSSAVEAAEDCTIQPSATTGTSINLTASSEVFASTQVGLQIELEQEVESSSVTKNFTSSDLTATTGVYVGDSWQIISHGTWTGTIVLESSPDNSTWSSYRTYTASDDYNFNESGSVSDKLYLRVKATSLSSGTCNATLTALPYTHKGRAEITAVTNSTNATATVLDNFGGTSATKEWRFSVWNSSFGYPRTVTFFQDRLCFGGSTQQPYMLWMSRTGDYGNFSVEKVSGTVTDDSAVAAAFISRKQFEIKHLIANTDLLVLTDGNEWIVSGSEVVTPTKVTPKMQTTRGCSNVEPMTIGNKLIYVQGRGSVVRDMGYSWDSDSYTGNDLTLLASHLIEEHKFIDCCYKQQPDSVLYFVRDDGVICSLSYVIEQNVFAWSTLDTNGEFKAVCSVREGEKDVVYAIVERDLGTSSASDKKWLLECFVNNDNNSSVPNDYVCLDCCSVFSSTTATNTFSVPQLANQTVDVVGDGRVYTNYEVSAAGVVTIPGTAKDAVIGLPYTMKIELPNIEIKTGNGTMQGRQKIVTECILRLRNSLGGYIGPDFDTQDEIKFDELSSGYGSTSITLFSGEKRAILPVGGFNYEGRIAIASSVPYPFDLLMAVREVTFGG